MPRAPKSTKAPLPVGDRARRISRFGLALLISLAALWMGRDFLVPVGWAILIAISTWPIYAPFKNWIAGSRDSIAAPLLFTLLTGLLLFVPVAIAAHRVSQEGQAIADSFNHYRQNGIPTPGWLSEMPGLGQQAAQWWHVNLTDAKAAAEWIGAADTKKDEVTRAVGAEVLHRFFLFIISLIALFNLLRHGPWMTRRLLDAADRFLGDPGEQLASKMVDAIRGTVNGTVVVAVVEGCLIGAGYLLAGVANAFLFTVMTIAFAMLPFGAWAVFTAASILLVLQGGSVVAAFGLFTFGAVVMLVGDLFVWPAFVGNAARLPFLVALIGIFGGLQMFGLIGLFVGPVIMAALLIIWRQWLVGTDSRA